MAAALIKVSPEIEMKLFEARVAEQAEAYDDMFEIVKELVLQKIEESGDSELSYTNEERVLMSSCFKKYIKENQKALKTLFIVKDPVKNPSKSFNQVQNGLELFTQMHQWQLRDQCLNVVNFLSSTHSLHREDRDDYAP